MNGLTLYDLSPRAPLLAGRWVVGKAFAGDFEPTRKPQVQQPSYQTTPVAPDVCAVNNSSNRSYEDRDGAPYKQASQSEPESDAHFEDKKNDRSNVSFIASAPSMLSGTIFSSLSSVYGNIKVAFKLELMDLLLNDHQLRPLFGTAFQLPGPFLFERNFTKLLKTYANELQPIATSKLQKWVVHHVCSQRSFVADCIRNVYVSDSHSTEKFPQFRTQNPARDQALEKFFRRKGLVPKEVDPDWKNPDVSEIEDSKQPNLPNLTQVRNFMISGEPFENLRKNFDRIIRAHKIEGVKAVHDYKKQMSLGIQSSVEENHEGRWDPQLEGTTNEVVEHPFRDVHLAEEARISQTQKGHRDKRVDPILKEFPHELQGWSSENTRKFGFGRDIWGAYGSEPAATFEELTAKVQFMPPATSSQEHHGEPSSQPYRDTERSSPAAEAPQLQKRAYGQRRTDPNCDECRWENTKVILMWFLRVRKLTLLLSAMRPVPISAPNAQGGTASARLPLTIGE